MEEFKKRNVAYRIRIGDILKSRPVLIEGKFAYIDLGGKQVVRVNLLANCVDKFVQEGEKKFASLTVDDASGQIKLKSFGEEIESLKDISQGDTIQIIGNVREWNGEVYVLPEVIKKVDPRWLLVRKLELQAQPQTSEVKEEKSELRDAVLKSIRDAEAEGGIEKDRLTLQLDVSKEKMEIEVKKLLEEGLVYEPRPGKLRYLG